MVGKPQVAPGLLAAAQALVDEPGVSVRVHPHDPFDYAMTVVAPPIVFEQLGGFDAGQIPIYAFTAGGQPVWWVPARSFTASEGYQGVDLTAVASNGGAALSIPASRSVAVLRGGVTQVRYPAVAAQPDFAALQGPGYLFASDPRAFAAQLAPLTSYTPGTGGAVLDKGAVAAFAVAVTWGVGGAVFGVGEGGSSAIDAAGAVSETGPALPEIVAPDIAASVGEVGPALPEIIAPTVSTPGASSTWLQTLSAAGKTLSAAGSAIGAVEQVVGKLAQTTAPHPVVDVALAPAPAGSSILLLLGLGALLLAA